MYKVLIASLLIAGLSGCNSTSSNVQNAQTGDNTEVTDSYKELSDSELVALAKSTDFSAQELREAAKKLGYKCSVSKTTGSRIKKKVCSSEEQRLARKEAEKTFIDRMKEVERRPAPTVAPMGR